MQRINPFIQEVFRLNGVGSLQDIHVMLRHHKSVFVGSIQGLNISIDIRKELSLDNTSEHYYNTSEYYIILTGGSNTLYRTKAYSKYKSMETMLTWVYEQLQYLYEYDRVFQELGYKILCPMKYVRESERSSIIFNFHRGRWTELFEEKGTESKEHRTLEKDLFTEIVEFEKKHMSLEELPSLNPRLKDLLVSVPTV